MNAARWCVAGCCMLVFCLAGCTGSVYPLTGEPAADLELDGKWARVGAGAGPAEVELHGRNDSYRGMAWSREFVITVFTIGDHHYANLKYDDSLELDAGPKLLHKLNLFARIEFEDDELRIFQINDPQAFEFLRRHETDFIDEEGKFIVITANREQLQQLVRDHGDELFMKSPSVYRRER